MAIGARATTFLLHNPGLQHATLRPVSSKARSVLAQSPLGSAQHRSSGTAVTACLTATCAALAGIRRGQRRWPASRHRPQHRLSLQSRSASAHHKSEPVPVVLLSGFLGTGKTTLLQHWLTNSDQKIGVVVNDMAAVNIDAKLLKQQRTGSQGKVETIQLENGCACCSLGDELITTINDLVQLSEGDEPFSLVIVELTGVAEPRRVRENFERAQMSGLEEFTGVQLEKTVTLVDSSTFCQDYMEFSRIYERPDLMEEEAGEMAEAKVVELLVEQVEEADVVILNKVDLAEDDILPATRAVIKALNKKAAIRETSFGRIDLSSILADPQEVHSDGHTHGESHVHEHAEAHSHGGHASHGEEEGHSSGHQADCADPKCTDHSHGHSHSHAEDCSDPHCSDPSHGHTHSHSSTTAEDRFGIESFTYRARRPFHADRLAAMLTKWPVPKKDCLGELLEAPDDTESKSPFARVIRSKGFCWLETYPGNRMYWSHAGKSLSLDFDWPWWGSLPEEELEAMDKANPLSDYRRAKQEDWCDEWADRRQEIVFIGQKMDEAHIREMLDGCLLKEGSELEEYRQKQDKDKMKNSLGAWETVPGV